MAKFYGKYRGTVKDNSDPRQLGRLRIEVPEIYDDDASGWAMPCLPYAGPGVGFFALPPVAAMVWVEFEGGDADYPIWTGCYWGAKDDLPFSPPDDKVIGIKTAKTTLKMSDTDGTITLEVAGGLKLTINGNGSSIELVNNGAKITLTSSTVSVNDGALEVT